MIDLQDIPPDQRAVLIVATPSVAVEDLSDEEDAAVPGVYLVRMARDTPDDTAASIALDMFHCNVPVSTLDEFDFSVVDPVTGRYLEEADDAENYARKDEGVFCGKVSDNPDDAAPVPVTRITP